MTFRFGFLCKSYYGTLKSHAIIVGVCIIFTGCFIYYLEIRKGKNDSQRLGWTPSGCWFNLLVRSGGSVEVRLAEP